MARESASLDPVGRGGGWTALVVVVVTGCGLEPYASERQRGHGGTTGDGCTNSGLQDTSCHEPTPCEELPAGCPPVCGDGVVEGDEVCDDGNTESNDGCREDCLGVEVCGDGLVDPAAGEHCDPPQDGGCIGACSSCQCPPPGPWGFVDATVEAGLDAIHGYAPEGLDGLALQSAEMAGGVAAGDVNGDGAVDLYTVGGPLGRSALWLNQGDGTFVDATASAGIVGGGPNECGPLFADVDGNGGDDLLVGGVNGTPPRLFLNQLDGTFVDATMAAGLAELGGNVVGAAMADVDGDGDLDLALGRWGTPAAQAEHLFVNEGGLFVGSGALGGLGEVMTVVATFTPNFDHFDDDDAVDLAFTSDFGTSRLFLGTGAGSFLDVTSSAVTDDNGMGAATGDVDGDGDVDWFVSSIWDPDGVAEANWGVSGNRLYLNDGSGQLSDATEAAGVREGYWGWGACLADFDNDGHLDIFHANGFGVGEVDDFAADPAALFLARGDGTFVERALELGLDDRDQGRGVSCFDADGDGALDIVVHNNRGPLRLWRNNGVRVGHHLVVRLAAPPPNWRAIGARVTIVAGGRAQVRTIKAGSNFASQDPPLAHFGLGDATAVESVTVRWPDGTISSHGPTVADQGLTLTKPPGG